MTQRNVFYLEQNNNTFEYHEQERHRVANIGNAR